jgi:N-acetylglucosaminyl-diphospho-decaprenol L-rhamnosyltransferase
LAGPAIVVVTYNSEDVVQSCVEACLQALPECEAVVVDNASTDGTVERARALRATVIANPTNRGFAAAVNQGFRATTADLVLIMNPDVRITSGLGPLAAACREHGLAGGRLTDANGNTQRGFTIRRFPSAAVLGLELLGVNRLWHSNPWNREYRYLDRDLSVGGAAEQPAGAFLMVRRDVWKKLDGMDESFWPIWFEDVDFCRRAAVCGFVAQYVPESSAVHSGGHSIQKIDGASRQLYWYDSLLRYAGKHFRPAEFRILCLAGVFGALLRTIPAMIQERSLRPAGNYLGILKFLGRRLVSRPPSGLAQRPGSEY